MRLIDSHCHIDGERFDADRSEVLARARAAGVTPFIVIGTGNTLTEIRRAVTLAEAEPDVFAAVGVHPHDASAIDDAGFAELATLVAHPRVVAVGETGLDFHYDHSPRDAQEVAFRRQLRLAHAVGKPVVCHIRNAHAEAMSVVDDEQLPAAGGVIHCFTGTPDEARGWVARGFHLSFSGIVTFPAKSADPIRAALHVVPEDRLLVETDAPFLAPAARRGQRNEPAFVVDTASFCARELGVPESQLFAAVTANARRLFQLPPV